MLGDGPTTSTRIQNNNSVTHSHGNLRNQQEEAHGWIHHLKEIHRQPSN